MIAKRIMMFPHTLKHSTNTKKMLETHLVRSDNQVDYDDNLTITNSRGREGVDNLILLSSSVAQIMLNYVACSHRRVGWGEWPRRTTRWSLEGQPMSLLSLQYQTMVYKMSLL